MKPRTDNNTTATRRVRKLVAVVALAVVGVAVLVTPAAANWDLCAANGYLCVYKNNDGADGGVKTYGGADTNYSDNNFDRCYVSCGVNDSVSSQWNRESYTVRSYTNSSYGGSAFDTGASSAHYSLCCGYNDAVSSHRGI